MSCGFYNVFEKTGPRLFDINQIATSVEMSTRFVKFGAFVKTESVNPKTGANAKRHAVMEEIQVQKALQFQSTAASLIHQPAQTWCA